MHDSSQIPSPNVTATRLTAPGRGAVASIRLSCVNPDDAAAIDAAFTAANQLLPSSAPLNRVLFGSWRGEDVVVVRTADTSWEVHCHGGEAAVARILNEFSTADATDAARTTDFEQLLLQTRTTKTARLVLAQSAGLLQRTLLAIAHAGTTADFGRQLTDLLRWESVADHLTVPWSVVIAGPPNSGKSSLLNAIAGYQRSIVFDQPGTTRDAVRTELVLHGWPFCFVDTAGIRRDADDPVERLGIAHAQKLFRTADLILIAVDASVGWTADHAEIAGQLPESCSHAVVVCKRDLAASGVPPPGNLSCQQTSAVLGSGLRELTDWVVAELVAAEPTLDTPLPVAGTAGVCRQLLQRLEQGQSVTVLRQELLNWLNTWSRSRSGGSFPHA